MGDGIVGDRATLSMLDGVLVVEVGSRIAAGACGSLLAQAGATVVFVEPAGDPPSHGKWLSRSVFAAGKESVVIDTRQAAHVALLEELLARADIVLSSTDSDGALGELAARSGSAAIRCDFSAFGADAGRSGAGVTDQEIQSLSGVAYTSGFPGEAPVPLRVPVIEYSAAVYGAAAAVLGLIGADRGAAGQTIEVSLYDCAINSLLTFLPAHFAGSEPGRLGNGHSMAVPWNAYRATDGWILVCSATDPQWQSICEAMQRPELSTDPRFARLAERVANRETVDRLLADWVARHDVDACAERLAAFGVAHGPVLPIAEIAADRNLLHRGMVLALADPATEGQRRLPGSPLRFGTGQGRAPSHIPAPDDGRERVERLVSQQRRRGGEGAGRPGPWAGRRPLEGLRVVEIGQYTTAPLAGRHLASFGAQVIKVEPPTGDAARAWRPVRDGLSLFFAMSNAGKTSVALDLRSESGRAHFATLLGSADILVENLKPGSLARLGFSAERLATLNPRLIYCAITGFGAASIHGERPAFDTVIQAMSGMMDVNASGGRPLKAGISICDVMGGEIGLFAILSALRRRERTGTGLSIDLSMHDIAAWMTAPFWPGNSSADHAAVALVECADGHALVTGGSRRGWPFDAERPRSDLPRRDLAGSLAGLGLRCTPILSISEAVADETTRRRKLILEASREGGALFPLVASPMRIPGMPASPGGPVGDPQPFEEAVFAAGGAPAELVRE